MPDRISSFSKNSALGQQRIDPYFQPICDATNGDIVIHELLMRFQLGGKVITAGEFIEEVERRGIAHKMDCHLVEKALAEVIQQAVSALGIDYAQSYYVGRPSPYIDVQYDGQPVLLPTLS